MAAREPSKGNWPWFIYSLWNAYRTEPYRSRQPSFKRMFPRPCKGPLRASKTYIPPHWNSMEVEDGSCLRKAAGPGLFADFETQIKWVSKTIYKPPIFPSATPRQHGNEGRIVPSKDSWSWLICWLSNLYRTNFKGLQNVRSATETVWQWGTDHAFEGQLVVTHLLILKHI